MNISVMFLGLGLVSVLLAGCGPMFTRRLESKELSLGSIDLSTNGERCENAFTWPGYYPGLLLTLAAAGSSIGPIGAHPDCALALQVDVIDKRTGKLVKRSQITKERMVFANGTQPTVSLFLPMVEWHNTLKEGHAYKLTMTVLQGQKDLGPAHISMRWIVGGESM